MKKKLLLGITASSAIWKVIPLIEQLNEKLDVEIEIIQTNSSTKFINPLMFQTLNRKKVHTDLFEEIDGKINHIYLAQTCDLFLLVPATNNTIAKIANGISDNLLTTVISAIPKNTPKLFAPAMNNEMYASEITQENISKLQKRGFIEIPPQQGILSSGKLGNGVLADIQIIFEQVELQLNQQIS